MAFSWERFFTNWRNLTSWPQHYVEEGAKSVLSTPPTSVIQPLWKIAGQEEPSSKKPYQQVWGFEQDKANYGNERNGDSLTWRDLSIHNNDTDEDFSISVGYDSDGRISGVRKNENGNIKSYYGQDLVGDFFKSNFDRDATNYTVFDEGSDDGAKYVLFDSEHDGAFIPSESLNMKRVSQRVPVVRERTDKPPVSLRDSINEVYDEMAARRGTSYALPNEEKENAAYNGHMEPMKLRLKNKVTPDVYDDFINKRPIFKKMVSAWVAENDPDERERILRDYDKEYGLNNNPIFADFLTDLSWHDWGDKNDHENENAHFDYFGRMQFLDAMDEDFAFAEDAFNPYYRA